MGIVIIPRDTGKWAGRLSKTPPAVIPKPIRVPPICQKDSDTVTKPLLRRRRLPPPHTHSHNDRDTKPLSDAGETFSRKDRDPRPATVTDA